jgi:hypothetical protein
MQNDFQINEHTNIKQVEFCNHLASRAKQQIGIVELTNSYCSYFVTNTDLAFLEKKHQYGN